MSKATTPRRRVRSKVSDAFRAKTSKGIRIEGDSVAALGGDPDAIPTTAVERAIERYTGKKIPLHQAYPTHPPEAPENAALAMQPNYPVSGVNDPQDPEAALLINSEEAYRKEVRLNLVHKLILRRANMQQIATALDTDMRDAYTLRTELYRRMRQEAGRLDTLTFVGETRAFFMEMRGTFIRKSDAEGMSEENRQRWLALAMATQRDYMRFMQMTGFFDNAKYQPAVEDVIVEDDDMSILRTAMKEVMDPTAFENSVDRALAGEEEEAVDIKTTDELTRFL